MSKEKQIEEMAKDVTYSIVWDSDGYATVDCLATAQKLHLKGYRKQSEGEWIDADPNGHLYRFTCSLCGKTKLGRGTPYCPNCGAKMKGGAE